MDFVVDRKTWYRGKGGEESKLLRADGTRCCIGFVGQQCGIADIKLRGIAEVHGTSEDSRVAESWPTWIQDDSGVNDDIADAYAINDDEELSDVVREDKLSKLFAKHGDTIRFVD